MRIKAMIDRIKPTIEYDERTVTIWLRVGNKRYMICQASGELESITGRDISDYYWSGHADEIKAIFRSLDGLSLPVKE
jgi:hypothetical protein